MSGAWLPGHAAEGLVVVVVVVPAPGLFYRMAFRGGELQTFCFLQFAHRQPRCSRMRQYVFFSASLTDYKRICCIMWVAAV